MKGSNDLWPLCISKETRRQGGERPSLRSLTKSLRPGRTRVTPRVTGHPAAQGSGPGNPERPCPPRAEVTQQANKVLYLGGEWSSSPSLSPTTCHPKPPDPERCICTDPQEEAGVNASPLRTGQGRGRTVLGQAKQGRAPHGITDKWAV